MYSFKSAQRTSSLPSGDVEFLVWCIKKCLCAIKVKYNTVVTAVCLRNKILINEFRVIIRYSFDVHGNISDERKYKSDISENIEYNASEYAFVQDNARKLKDDREFSKIRCLRLENKYDIINARSKQQ